MVPGEVARTGTEARAIATRIGFPVALKAIGPDILHKADVGGVVLHLRTPDELVRAWHDLNGRLGSRMSGGLVQKMVPEGVEMLIGVSDDPIFGPVITCAMGGTLTELVRDTASRLPPLTDVDAASMVDGLKAVQLLRGYRGRPRADEAALRESLLRLSALVKVCPEIREADINPLVVLPRGAVAIDLRVRVEPLAARPASRRIVY
jgi:acyl-CoA synthetase (NDP forming)